MDTSRLNVLILQEKIPDYRHQLFESVNDYANITVGCVISPENAKKSKYQIEKIKVLSLFNMIKLSSPLQFRNRKFDVIIIMFNIRWPGFLSYLLFNKKAKIYLWGHARRVSKWSRPLRYYIAKLAHGTITYSESEKRYLTNLGWQSDKIHVLANSVAVSADRSKPASPTRDSFLYVGALDVRKNLKSLIEAYKLLTLENTTNCPPLNIIGSGPQERELKHYCVELELESFISFHGRITDECTLKPYFETAIAYISPGATGLGIKHAAGYGTVAIINDTFENGPEVDVFQENSACVNCDGSVPSIFDSLNYCINHQDELIDMRTKVLKIYNDEDFNHMITDLKKIICIK